MPIISFMVYGSAVPQRERSFVGGGHIGRYVTKETHNWRAVIKAQAVEHKPEVLPTGAIRLAVEFVLPRPGYLMAGKYYWRCKSRKCGWKGTEEEHKDVGVFRMLSDSCRVCGGAVKPGEPTPPHTVKPDWWDNLMKPCLDALKGLFFNDDAQITSPLPGYPCGKRFAEIGEQPHISIAIEMMEIEG